jgi:uncharacterized glyoxalase superfamily protein PhnB
MEAVMTKKVPEGFATITPTLVLEDADAAIALYTKALGAKEDYRMEMPGSKKIMHACLTIGSSKLFLSDAMPNCGAPTNNSRFYLYVDDVDAAFKTATKAGLEQMMEPADMFWGDRLGAVKDKFGISWSIATHKREVSPAEMEKGQKEFLAKMAA